jgi:aspartokinase/homoserine dehydrogenase 1
LIAAESTSATGLLVMKFGGTSMGTADRIRIAADLIAKGCETRPVIAVVSAMSRITDLLLDTMKHAEAGDRAGLNANIEQLANRHRAACRELLPEAVQAPTLSKVDTLITEFQRIVSGMMMLGDRPAKSVDEAVAVGERLSSMLLAAHLNSRGTKAESINGSQIIVTDAVFGNASPVMTPTAERAHRILDPLLSEGVVPVITGFNGATIDGRPTTLGRGGSDFSASIIAAAIDASELWIWTDVDGIMTADPRLVPNAKILAEVSFREAAELAYNGAKILHPRTLAPLVDKAIPVWSKNSFAPEKTGTRIVGQLTDSEGARAVTSMRDVALISIETASAAMSGVQVMARALDAIARTNIEILAISGSSYRQSFCFLVRSAELQQTLGSLEAALALEIAHDYVRPIEVDENVGLLAVVGEGMRGTPGLAGRVFTAISREEVNIIAIAQGSSELTIAIVVRREGLEKAVRAVHAECHL